MVDLKGFRRKKFWSSWGSILAFAWRDRQTKTTRNSSQDSQCCDRYSNTAYVHTSHKHNHLNKHACYLKQMSILYTEGVNIDERTQTFRNRCISYRTISKSVSASQLGNIFTTFHRHFITSSVNRWDGVELPAVSYKSLIRALQNHITVNSKHSECNSQKLVSKYTANSARKHLCVW